MRKTLLTGLLLLLLAACGDQQPEIPYRKVRFTVSIPSTNLNYVGGYEYFTGGVSGVVVYRYDIANFMAFDRACPHDWEEGGRVEVVNSIFLYDSLCGSMFNILDGTPVGGPSKGSLRPYNAVMEDDFMLRVFN